MRRTIGVHLAILALCANLFPPHVVRGGEQEDKAKLFAALDRIEDKINYVDEWQENQEYRLGVQLGRMIALNERADKQQEILGTIFQNEQQFQAEIGQYCAYMEEFASRIKVVNGEFVAIRGTMNEALCYIQQANCILQRLPGNIRRSQRRYFVVGLLVGLGIGFGVSGAFAGAHASASAVAHAHIAHHAHHAIQSISPWTGIHGMHHAMGASGGIWHAAGAHGVHAMGPAYGVHGGAIGPPVAHHTGSVDPFGPSRNPWGPPPMHHHHFGGGVSASASASASAHSFSFPGFIFLGGGGGGGYCAPYCAPQSAASCAAPTACSAPRNCAVPRGTCATPRGTCAVPRRNETTQNNPSLLKYEAPPPVPPAVDDEEDLNSVPPPPEPDPMYEEPKPGPTASTVKNRRR